MAGTAHAMPCTAGLNGGAGMNKKLILALLIPILFLLLNVIHKQYLSTTGTVVTLPVEGFDPRDLLSGHYVEYRVKYETSNSCYDVVENHVFQKLALCLQPERMLYTVEDLPASCKHYLLGQCQGENFIAGIERFYIPDEYATELDQKLRDEAGSIEVSVSNNGSGIVKSLLIDGEDWLDFVQNQ
jgi:uncharacterized membrane-anchored protein